MWQPFLTLEGGGVRIEVNDEERRNLQIVFTGECLLDRLYRAGMIWLEWEQKEFVLRGYHAELRQRTAIATYPESLGGVFFPWDFRKLFWEDASNWAEFERRNGQVMFRRGTIAKGSSHYSHYACSQNQDQYHQTYRTDREYVLRA